MNITHMKQVTRGLAAAAFAFGMAAFGPAACELAPDVPYAKACTSDGDCGSGYVCDGAAQVCVLENDPGRIVRLDGGTPSGEAAARVAVASGGVGSSSRFRVRLEVGASVPRPLAATDRFRLRLDVARPSP